MYYGKVLTGIIAVTTKIGGSKQLNPKESLTTQNQNDLNIQGENQWYLNDLM